ncbi:serine/threonine-protein kinase fray2-like [Dysidea avara]|uniref:serine/threonine-protein kinase fray2-like n=1 Tax=Dysidea avara TaxID=196820 RepID=UPI00331E48F3
MTDINATLQKLSDQFQSLREDVNSIKRRKSKKKKSSRRSRSRERRHRSRSRTRRRSRSQSRGGYSPRVSRSRSRSPSRSRGSPRSRSRESGITCSPSKARSRSRTGHRDGKSRSRSRSYSRSQSRGHSRSRCGTRHSRSRSRSRTPSPVSKFRNWEDLSDDPDYEEQVVFHESDTETRTAKTAPPTRLAEVTGETAAFLKEKCSKRLESANRLTTRNAYALPKVPATRTSVLDAYMKPEVSQTAKASDRELGSIQSAVLDAMAPLTAIVEADAKGDNVTHRQAVNAAKAAIELVGNANARINHMRRTKIITQMNKALLPLTEEDDNFIDAAPSLFGPAFAQKSKELVDQVKAMRFHLPGHKDNKHQFFRNVPPNSRGGYQYSQRPRRGGNHSGRGYRRPMQGQRPQWNK